MTEITVQVGSATTASGGVHQDNRREVKFAGVEVASRTEYGTHKGNVSDTRGVTETLYRTDDGRLVVHVKDWSRWQGEPSTYSLHEVSEADLGVGGRFEMLGAEAGYGRPLTLDEAIRKDDVASVESRPASALLAVASRGDGGRRCRMTDRLLRGQAQDETKGR